MSGGVTGRHGNLPTGITSFVGRRSEIAHGKALLSAARMLTLTGVGGVGKTRLALRIADEVRRAFPDGVWLVELAPLRDEELLVATVTAALKVGDEAADSPVARLSEHLADKRLLLVLDNCEHMIDGCAMLAGKLLGSAPELKILATSRQALGIDGESLLTVPPLSLPDPGATASAGELMRSEAVQLFADRAAAVLPDFTLTRSNAGPIAAICRRLDGIPLAIELAAVRMRALSAEAILERLDHRFRLLTSGSRDALPRHRTLRAAIEWSHDLCSSNEKLLWARMAVFAGACELEAIEQVCSAPPIRQDEVFELVAGLIDKSIVIRETYDSRLSYRLLETLREFGDDLLTESGEGPAVRVRHWEYYRRLVRRAEAEWFAPGQAEWFARMRLEQPNLRTALEFSLTEPGHAQAGLEAAASLHIPWVITGALREGSRWLRRALDLNPEPTRARAKALHGCAYLLIMLGDLDAAREMLAECRVLGERLGDASALAYAAVRLGSAKLYAGDVAGAFPLLEESLAGQRRLNDQFGIMFALRHLAMAATAADDPRAEAYGQEFLALCERHGAELSRSWALWALGIEQWRRGRTDRAVALLRESLRVKSRVYDLVGEAHCLEVMAWAAESAGDMRRAARLLGGADATSETVGSSLIKLGYLRRFREPVERRVRRKLGEGTYAALRREGEQLGCDVIGYALGEDTGRRRPPAGPEGPSPLTPRELQVAELVGQGLSNKEIAARLVIAQRTAEGHVEHILAKLGFGSRAQIAAWVAERRAAS